MTSFDEISALSTNEMDTHDDVGRNAPFSPAEEEERLHAFAADLTAVVPVDPRGRHELLRLATGLAQRLPGSQGAQIAAAAEALRIRPAHVDRVVTGVNGTGVLAIVEGRLIALGRRPFLQELGVKPHPAEAQVADRIERTGDLAYFVVAIARARCLGVVGVHPYK